MPDVLHCLGCALASILLMEVSPLINLGFHQGLHSWVSLANMYRYACRCVKLLPIFCKHWKISIKVFILGGY